MADEITRDAHATVERIKNDYKRYVRTVKSTPIPNTHVQYDRRRGGVQYAKPLSLEIWRDSINYFRYRYDYGTAVPVPRYGSHYRDEL
jgi:hypothetical protein